MRNSFPNPPPPPLPLHAQVGSIAATVRGLGVGVRPSEVWRAAAFTLLRLNPQECEALGLVFEDEAATDEVRTMVLDLLAGAGSFEAQVVIRRLLALAVARRDGRQFATFVQRLAIVETPDGPTLRFLMSVYAESRGEPQEIRAACAYALGAAAGQAFAAGDVDAAVRASDTLRRDLLSVGSGPEKCALVTALGNAGVSSDVMVISRFTTDTDGAVRAAAALALRKLNVPEARAQLVAMMGDQESRVVSSALVALGEQKLDDPELQLLAEQVLDGRTPLGLDGRILQLIVAQRPRVVSGPGRACAVENALRLLLGRVEAATQDPPTVTGGAGSGERRLGIPAAPVGKRPAAAAMMTAPQRAYVHHTPMPSPAAAIAVTTQSAMPPPMSSVQSVFPTPLPPPPETSQALPDTRRVLDGAATIIDASPLDHLSLPLSAAPPTQAAGGFRMVSPGDSVETVRARMLELGLDPNARGSVIPQPPPRRPSSMPAPAAAAIAETLDDLGDEPTQLGEDPPTRVATRLGVQPVRR